jgi:23S rRNA (uracil1939-C5)-methyltransferase
LIAERSGIDSLRIDHYGFYVNAKFEKRQPRRDSRAATRRGPLQPAAAKHPCPHFPHCIGCPLTDVPYPEQLVRKREIISRALSGYPSLARIDIPPVAPAPHRLGYRARVKLVVRSTSGEVAAGLYVPGTHRVMDMSGCAVHPRAVNRVVSYLKKKCLELNIAPYDERVDSGQLRYLDLRYSFARREVSVTLVTRHRQFPEGGPLARALMRKFSFVNGVIQNINEQRGNVIWGDSYRVLAGRDTLLERIGSLMLAFPAGVFSQANPAMAARLYTTVAEMARLSAQDAALDLYCGVGPISLTLAQGARLVWGADDSSLAIDAAKQNARRNGVGNCRFFFGDVAATIAAAKNSLDRIDCVVVNPPRKGLQPAALKSLGEVQAPRVVYVSCEPASLCRDLDQMAHHGYEVRRLQPFDMFPQTEQIETVALLTR